MCPQSLIFHCKHQNTKRSFPLLDAILHLTRQETVMVQEYARADIPKVGLIHFSEA